MSTGVRVPEVPFAGTHAAVAGWATLTWEGEGVRTGEARTDDSHTDDCASITVTCLARVLSDHHLTLWHCLTLVEAP